MGDSWRGIPASHDYMRPYYWYPVLLPQTPTDSRMPLLTVPLYNPARLPSSVVPTYNPPWLPAPAVPSYNPAPYTLGYPEIPLVPYTPGLSCWKSPSGSKYPVATLPLRSGSLQCRHSKNHHQISRIGNGRMHTVQQPQVVPVNSRASDSSTVHPSVSAYNQHNNEKKNKQSSRPQSKLEDEKIERAVAAVFLQNKPRRLPKRSRVPVVRSINKHKAI